MTKIRLLTNQSQTLKELLNKINVNEHISLEIELENNETLLLNLEISPYEKINIINTLLSKNIISSAIHIDHKEKLKNSYTLNKLNINRQIKIYKDQFRREVLFELLDILHRLGIKTHHLGYTYIKEAIYIVYYNKTIINNMTEVYKKISIKYNTSISSVESNIRRAIEEGFKNASPDDIKQIFGYSLDYQNVCPTNSVFILTISDILKTKFNRYNN